MKIKNNLNIDDANISIMRNEDKMTKELILSYKTIYTNTYNLTIIDISNVDDNNIIIKHDSFQLWESRCMGFFVEKTSDFIILNKEGVIVLVLADVDSKIYSNSDSKELVVHSLHSSNHLKIDKSNFIEFDFTEKVGFIKV